jgi:hypothetical protein
MTQTLAINSNNDIYLGSNGNLVVATGQTGVEQACQTATQAQLGEMILATTSGIPNFQAVWSGTPNLAIWESYLRAAILNVPGVLAVVSLSSSVAKNTLSYTATISSQYGIFELNGITPTAAS